MAKRSATELFEHYYMALVYSLPIKDADFMDELPKHDLLPGDVKSKLESLAEINERSSYFLDNVIKPGLEVGNNRCFVSLLAVMKYNKHDNIKELATKIGKDLTIEDVKYSSKPLLKDLYNIIIPKVANDWYDLGVQLFSESQLPRLDEISTTFSNDRRRGCVEMLKYWLKIIPEATWDNLIHALRAPGLELLAIADDVEKEVKDVVKDHELTNVEKSSKVTGPEKLQSLPITPDRPNTYSENFEDEDVVVAFARLFYDLGILFGKVDFVKLKNACIQRGTLLPNEFKQQIKAAVELDDLLDALDNPMYCNWLNIRLLKRIVKTINIPEAKHLIQAYEECVYSRKVSEVMTYFDPRCFNPSHVSLVNAKIMRSFANLTVADIIKYCERLESNMGVYAGSVTATECQPGCLQITCVIPLHCALHAYEMAKTNFLQFRQFHIHYIEIEPLPKIYALNFCIKENDLDRPASEDSGEVISHYYTCLENYMDADSVSHMMHCEHLITDDDYEAITAAPNDNKMNTLLLQYVRSMNVNQLSKFCDILKSIETHKIIGDCSSPFFQGLLLKLSTNVRVSPSQQSMASSIECMKISEVNIIFCDLIDHLYLHLSATEKLSFNLRKYKDINLLFTEQWLEKVTSLYLFRIYLLTYITWLDHSILKELVVASGSEDAQQLLNLFDSKIDSYCSQPITSFPILSPSQLMIPLDDSEYTLLAMKFRPPSRGDTTQDMIILQDVMDIKLIMKSKWELNDSEIHRIQLVAVDMKYEMLYWMIPNYLAEVIEGNLVHDWKSGIIMMAVLPPDFHSLEDNNEIIKGPFSSLNSLWKDDSEVLSSTSIQNKLVNVDIQNFAQQYVQLQHNIKTMKKESEMVGLNLESSSYSEAKEKKTSYIRLRQEISEMTSHMKILELEILKLKEDNKRVTKHFGAIKTEDQVSILSLKAKETKTPEEEKDPEILDKSRKSESPQSQIKEITIEQLMNIVPLIQEKWSFIGTRLKLSSDKLDNICQAASEQQIPAESKNTFCCVKMLTSWYETSNDVSVDAIMMAIDAPHVGLKTKITSIEDALTFECISTDTEEETSVTNPPEKPKQPYVDMITEFCLELSKSQHSVSDILLYLKVCHVNSDVVENVSDFPELVRSLERHELLNKSDLTWLKNIAHHAQCAEATAVVEEYESLLMADKIPWYSSHTTGTYLVGRTDKKPENVTIKDSSNAKSAASRIVNIKESDSVLDSTEVGSVTFYWKLVSKNVEIQIPEVVNASLTKECNNAGLTHVGIMIDGNLNWTTIDEIYIECSEAILDEWEIEHKCIELNDKLSDGVFNETWAGTWNGTTLVAVITPKPGLMTVFNFLAEVQVMKNLQHDKLIKLYGVCTREEPLYIVTELMKHGNLLDYLIKGEGQHLKLSELINISAQVANGMAYLESRHYIHRDLAARNILVGEGNIVKIGGFSLACSVVDGKYPRTIEKISVKWTAPETIRSRHFTIKSDVWSFGVFLTELVTHGCEPYPKMTKKQALSQVTQGYRMSRPSGCPDSLYQIMLECWKTDPEERPTFEYLKYQLEMSLDAWEIEHKSIELIGKLSDGVFNETWAGTWKGTWNVETPVAVIILKPGLMTVSDFLAEAQIMKNLQHDKLIKLYGVCTKEEPIYIVTESIEHGNLLYYLTKGEGQHLKLLELIDIGAQVADGMAYLESQHYIHRDLAARNILVGEGHIVKIGGFSLACSVVDGKYLAKQGDKIPVRWTAPDAPFNGFTIKSDVWSFGVFLTELVTHGRIPYTWMTNDKVLAQVTQGYRMPQPPGCPNPLYQIMLECWKAKPEERPTFENLKHQLENLSMPTKEANTPDHLLNDEYLKLIEDPEQNWYFGNITRDDAEKLLLMEGNETGTFLVRESGSPSAHYELLVRDGSAVKYYLVSKEHATAVEDLQCYARDADGLQLCTQLTTPCPMRTPNDNCEIPHRSIVLNYRLGHGRFSEVWKGTWNGIISVAVKTRKPGSMTVSDFLSEAQIMKKLGHKNILKLYGVCTQEEPFYIVTELLKHGSLLDYLTKGEGQHLKLPELIDIGAQVANGMAYLESQHCVHRDLAARNVLVGEGNIVKIGDFGLAQLVTREELETRSKKVPVKWTAPEVILFNQFTVKSDVWSFGVFLTEVVTYSRNPYPEMTNDEVLAQVTQGYRMPQPPGCPDPLYQIILDCWKTDPKQRPTFEYLKCRLEDF